MSAPSCASLLRQLPPPAPDERPGAQRRRAAALAEVRADALVEPAWRARIVALEAPPGATLRAGGQCLHAPRLVPASGRLTALGAVACTLGPRLEERVRAHFAARRPAAALALDELGTALLFALMRHAQDRLVAQAARRGLRVAGELAAGDPGLALDAQSAVLQLADGAAIGMHASAAGALHPLKSCTSVHGVGIALPASAWSRCDACPSAPRCTIARRRKETPA